jgi:hypothetical protein
VKGEGLLSWKLSVSTRGIVSNFLRGANARSGHISDHFPVLRSVYILWRSVNDILKIPELACPVSTGQLQRGMCRANSAMLIRLPEERQLFNSASNAGP